MIPISLSDLDRATARLYGRETRIVGWGTGSVFDYFHTHYPVRLDYIVDNDASRWGRRIAGVEVVSPSRLAAENPRETLVVIYSSAWPEIQRQIAALGPFAAVPASAAFVDASVREKLFICDSIAGEHLPPRSPDPEHSIVVQGPLIEGVTPHVVRVLAARHPESLLIVSTWRDTDPDVLDEVSHLADEIVVSDRPACDGIQNRNCQIVSTASGIARAMELGARYVLKTRTDLAVLSSSVFERGRWWLDRVRTSATRDAGAFERLIVPASYTRKFFLYHPSDLVMLGTASDMARYWSAPLDPRSGDLLSAGRIDQSVSSVSMDGNPTESYLGLQYCRSLDRAAQGTLRDSWDFYRDLFAVVDNDWFDLLWFKNLSIPDATLRHGIRQLVTPRFWEQLQTSGSRLDREAIELDPSAVTMGALASIHSSVR